MGVNGITEVTNNIATTYASSVTPSTEEKKDTEVKEKTQAAAVFEKSEESDTQNVASSKESDRTKIIRQMQADVASRQQQLLNIVQKMMGKQAKAYGIANSDNDEDSMW